MELIILYFLNKIRRKNLERLAVAKAAARARDRAAQVYEELLGAKYDLTADGTIKPLQYFVINEFTFFADLVKKNYTVTNQENRKRASSYGTGNFLEVYKNLIFKTI